MNDQIRIKDIDLEDERFRHFESFCDSSRLTESIQKTGLISPVLLKPVGERFMIIAGFNRIAAGIAANLHTIPAMVSSTDESECDSLIKAIMHVTFKRQLSHAELIRSLSHLSRFETVKSISKNAEYIFNMSLSETFVTDLIRIDSLPEPALQLLSTGRISPKTARQMLRFQEDQIPPMLDIFSNINASASVQREILLHLVEISKRDQISIESIIRSELIHVLNDHHLDSAAKTREIRKILFEKRYPVLSKARADAREKLNRLNLVKTLKIDISDTFEDPFLHFAFKIKTHDQFAEILMALEKIKDRKELSELLIS